MKKKKNLKSKLEISLFRSNTIIQRLKSNESGDFKYIGKTKFVVVTQARDIYVGLRGRETTHVAMTSTLAATSPERLTRKTRRQRRSKSNPKVA